MPGLNIQVALSEALEVRGGPLTEREIWAVLRQSVESLQDLFIKGEYTLKIKVRICTSINR